MPLEIIRNDITKVTADAIVNTANPEPHIGAGVDAAIYKAAGRDELLAERMKIGRMEPGSAKATPAFGLDAKWIIHTVGPAWRGGNEGEQETVAKCYRNSLELAESLGAESIAFPLISTGTYGFPKDLALSTAISEISSFLMKSEMDVFLVVYNRKAFELSEKLFNDVQSFIDESDVVTRDFGEYSHNLAPEEAGPARRGLLNRTLREESISDLSVGSALPEITPFSGEKEESIEEYLKEKDKTFQEYLFMLIDHKNLDEVEVYRRANIGRKLFSKIRSNVDYMPSRRTALALAIGMRLNLDETMDLLVRAGYALSPSSKADRIIEYFIQQKNYDINEINCVLFDYGQQLLGA